MAESGSRSVANTTSGLASSEPSCYDAVGDGREGRSALCADHVHHLWETKRDPQASKTRPGQKHKVGCQLGVEPEHLRADVHIQNGRGGRINTVGQPSHVVFGPGTREVGPRSPDSASFPVGLCEAPTALEAGLDADRHGTQLPSAISIEALWSFMGPSQASPNNLKLRGRWSADSSFKRYEGLPRLLSCTRSFPQK